MNQQSAAAAVAAEDVATEDALRQAIIELAGNASVEINVADVKYLEASRTHLAPGTRIFISHLPKQNWQDTEAACRAVMAAGFRPVPHIPARLLPDAATLERLLDSFAAGAQVTEVLLIAGDYAEAVGPYPDVSAILRSDLLNKHGMQRVSLAGHPEGHPKVAFDEIRRAERDKARLAAQSGLDAVLVTQLVFESAPFLDWARQLRADGVHARLVAGLAGPAGLATLFKFAVRCGVGPSIRTLGERSNSVMKLLGDHGPEQVMRELAAARVAATVDHFGVHMFCFGGYLRTCQWLRSVASGRFHLDHRGGFKVIV